MFCFFLGAAPHRPSQSKLGKVRHHGRRWRTRIVQERRRRRRCGKKKHAHAAPQTPLGKKGARTRHRRRRRRRSAHEYGTAYNALRQEDALWIVLVTPCADVCRGSAQSLHLCTDFTRNNHQTSSKRLRRRVSFSFHSRGPLTKNGCAKQRLSNDYFGPKPLLSASFFQKMPRYGGVQDGPAQPRPSPEGDDPVVDGKI
eukprot:gene21632-biopygen8668